MATNINSPGQDRPKIGIVAWIGRFWLCLAECIFRDATLNRGWIFGALLSAGLVAFEFFNFSTTEFALTDLIGDARFLALRWASILAFAFCAIDFAGLARLFTPDSAGERLEVWYLTGAWFLGATANAVMTWWAVLITMLNRTDIGNTVVGRETLLTYVPVFIAGLVWLTRIGLISTFALAGPRLFAAPEVEPKARPEPSSAAMPAGQPLLLRPQRRGQPRPRIKPEAVEPEVAAALPPKGSVHEDTGHSLN